MLTRRNSYVTAMSKSRKRLRDLLAKEENLGSDEYVELEYHRPQPEPQCGKLGYVSESSCRKWIKRRMKKGSNASWMRPYHCPRCKKWHITTAPKEH